MSSPVLAGVKRFIFWDYPRAVWQYDVMVAVIVAFIFLTPRDWFRDQPKASNIVMLEAGDGEQVFWIEPDLLSAVSEAGRASRAEALVRARTHKNNRVTRLESIYGSEDDIRGYMAYTRP